jgi:hypothetical protein
MTLVLDDLSTKKMTQDEYVRFMGHIQRRLFPDQDEIEVVRLYGELGIVLPPPVPDLVADVPLPTFLNPNRSFTFCVRKDGKVVALAYGIYSIEPYSQPVEDESSPEEDLVVESLHRSPLGAHAQVLGFFHTVVGEEMGDVLDLMLDGIVTTWKEKHRQIGNSLSSQGRVEWFADVEPTVLSIQFSVNAADVDLARHVRRKGGIMFSSIHSLTIPRPDLQRFEIEDHVRQAQRLARKRFRRVL